MKRWTLALLLFTLTGCDLFGPNIATLEIVPGDTMFVAGTGTQLKLIARDEEGFKLDDPANVVWTSAGRGLALSSSGFIRASEFGEAVITARVDEVFATATFRVNPRIDLKARAVYINQVIQNPDRPVPLIPGRDGLFRLFVVVDEEHYYMDPVKARVQLGGIDTVLVQESQVLRSSLDEGQLRFSYNMFIPKEMITPGLYAEIEYDPFDEIDGIEGRELIEFEVAEHLPLYRQTIVPFISTAHPRREVTEWVDDFSYDSESAWPVRTFIPQSREGTEFIKHELVSSDLNLPGGYNNWLKWLTEVEVIRQVEGGNGYYYGVQVVPSRSAIKGIGYRGGSPVSAGDTDGYTFAHEVGHNMSLGHAPCRVQYADENYPYTGGRIGQWGFDVEQMKLRSPIIHTDYMGYCPDETNWVSDYHFRISLRERYREDRARVAEEPVILLWGSITDREFEPAFRLTSLPTPEDPQGPYLAEGFSDSGERVFAHRFSPNIIAESNHESFMVAVPVAVSTAITSVTISGPSLSMTLTDGSVPRMIIERGPNGQVRAIRRDYQGLLKTRSPLGDLVSTGLPILQRR